MAAHTPGTWRRLKIGFEARVGHGIPRLPEVELVRLLGLLVGIRDGAGGTVVRSDEEQERLGRLEAERLRGEPIAAACARLAKTVDVRPFL